MSLALLPIVRRLPPPQEEAISVELLAPQQIETPATPPIAERPSEPPATSQPAEPIKKEPEPQPQSSGSETTRQPAAMVRATQFFSAKVLADPRSKKAREGLWQLATGERIVQLCNVEAMEQVHHWKAEFEPDFLVAYAMADTILAGRVLEAVGGALRSKGNWYNIRYRCEVAPDIKSVAMFEFSVGTEIPRDEWEAHVLTAEDGAGD
ncbi:DUF930 domain-containing protein [Sinorhizobium numidicum]|uniref:DUF930 domain-containing protein n=1 Tax=Sinorhizobium numidicum TaxID=680248 RepID=A0ABY8CW63_9HYPH|nr:DUF930 domain-containing protein [Sinorhizobium numidicum]WEX76221.1 DUF930 domain-containing protein [Sinorhizobium numidicum]WEX82880.1 DUF930 domain-containing protein [Sinorhizobium numidicum]